MGQNARYLLWVLIGVIDVGLQPCPVNEIAVSSLLPGIPELVNSNLGEWLRRKGKGLARRLEKPRKHAEGGIHRS